MKFASFYSQGLLELIEDCGAVRVKKASLYLKGLVSWIHLKG